MIELNLCYPPQSTLSLNFDEEITGNELKNRLFSVLSIETGSDLRLVCAGKVIQDHLSLSSQGKYSFLERNNFFKLNFRIN